MSVHSDRLRSSGLESVRDEHWSSASLCGPNHGGDPEWWHADNAADKTTATRWCMQCPVRMLCFEATMAEEKGAVRGARFGIRAGLNGLQRHRLALGKPAGAP